MLRNGGTSYANSGLPLLSRREVADTSLGDAIIAGGQTFANSYDPDYDLKRQERMSVIASNLASAKAATLSGVRRGRAGYGSGSVSKPKSGIGAGPNGEVLPLYTKWTGRDGKEVWLPNPALPDDDVFKGAGLGEAQTSGWQLYDVINDRIKQQKAHPMPFGRKVKVLPSYEERQKRAQKIMKGGALNTPW
nr:hypothetical protein [uncultured Gellertiella sp.]